MKTTAKWLIEKAASVISSSQMLHLGGAAELSNIEWTTSGLMHLSLKFFNSKNSQVRQLKKPLNCKLCKNK